MENTGNKQENSPKSTNLKKYLKFFLQTLARFKSLIYFCNVKTKRPHRETQKTFGEVAEWSIAPVLKTGVLRGTGGSNPSLSARNKEQRKLFLILFYRDTGNSFTSIQVKQNKDNRRRWLLISCQGVQTWDGRAKRSQFRPQSRQKTKQGKCDSVLVSCQGVQTWDGRAKRSQFRPQSRQKTKQGKRESVLVSCQESLKGMGERSEANPYHNKRRKQIRTNTAKLQLPPFSFHPQKTGITCKSWWKV